MTIERRSVYLWKQSKSLKKKKANLLPILLLVMVLAALGIFLFSPFFRIGEIKIEGLSTGNQNDLLASAREFLSGSKFIVLPSDHILFFYAFKNQLLNDFKSRFPQLASIQTSLDFPSSLVVHVRTREPVARWCILGEYEEYCLKVDSEGVVLGESVVSGSGELIIIRALTPVVPLSSEQVELGKITTFLIRLAEELKKDGIYINEFFEGKSYYEGFRAKSSAGWDLIFLPEGNVFDISRNILLLFQKELKGKESRIEYIDARLVNRIFYKLR